MNVIINSNPKTSHSVGLTLAQKLAETFEEPYEWIRVYDMKDGYFQFQFHQEWIELIKNCGRIIMPVAMWNYAAPAALKDFLDRIIKRGELWDLDESGRMIGLLKDRPAYIIMTSGEEYLPESPDDFVIPYLERVLSSIGIHDVRVFRVGRVESSRKLIEDAQYIQSKTEAMFKAFSIS